MLVREVLAPRRLALWQRRRRGHSEARSPVSLCSAGCHACLSLMSGLLVTPSLAQSWATSSSRCWRAARLLMRGCLSPSCRRISPVGLPGHCAPGSRVVVSRPLFSFFFWYAFGGCRENTYVVTTRVWLVWCTFLVPHALLCSDYITNDLH
jgi:hypothetical protein